MGRSILAEYLNIDPKFSEKITGNPEEKAKLTIVIIINHILRSEIQQISKFI